MPTGRKNDGTRGTKGVRKWKTKWWEWKKSGDGRVIKKIISYDKMLSLITKSPSILSLFLYNY